MEHLPGAADDNLRGTNVYLPSLFLNTIKSHLGRKLNIYPHFWENTEVCEP